MDTVSDLSFLDSYTGLENLRLLAQIKEKVEDGPLARPWMLYGWTAHATKKYRKYSLGMKLKSAVPCIFLGVCIAAAIMTGITFGVIHVF